MNGQTGKFVGDLPVDKAAAAKWFAGIAVGAGVLTYVIPIILRLLGIM